MTTLNQISGDAAMTRDDDAAMTHDDDACLAAMRAARAGAYAPTTPSASVVRPPAFLATTPAPSEAADAQDAPAHAESGATANTDAEDARRWKTACEQLEARVRSLESSMASEIGLYTAARLAANACATTFDRTSQELSAAGRVLMAQADNYEASLSFAQRALDEQAERTQTRNAWLQGHLTALNMPMPMPMPGFAPFPDSTTPDMKDTDMEADDDNSATL
ncbi:hypothetical protein SPRG_17751 [Saprolegnia parasitica CBS 223.65]|uniref:Uncharacterized protein n=1 Tax=Saprolegnia parasitica (strain CBS 223.65) TaxID=695850 RepID=A0A067BQ21_SAPPC|nr:hypothetical protein SPRG_17751 [Saprolegnia parasitica CBS 223.65]KDO16762.1 hypothetical protein SPRG_17751 [Saprolegnia parasitica CBS 223.65]|eukprot:XP_012212529.1 hypothetical protein SPRG_17751 [Saprolegnia parasitica CBS 223.65]